MRSTIESVLGSHSIYQTRREEYSTGQSVPFRVSQEPLKLTTKETTELQEIGPDIAEYFHTVDIMYNSDERVRELLDRGKPEIFLAEKPYEYLFVRPDIIITPKGFSVCEIETSPFGLALAEILNRAYQQSGQETIITNGTLPEYIQKRVPSKGTLIYTDKTQQYAGQLTFLADEVFSKTNTKEWNAAHISKVESQEAHTLYRGFYLSEYAQDPAVDALFKTNITARNKILPSPTPHLEEKAILSFVWDIRFQEYLRHQLGDTTFKHLREVIPPTWIVGEEKYFAPGLPNNISSAIDLSSLSRSKRAFVLKNSGFRTDSSWSEGVHFLHEKSAVKTSELLKEAIADTSTLHIIQDFTKAKTIPMTYEGTEGELSQMQGRIRLTPYVTPEAGTLIAIKATACENTDFIHASSSSINTAVAA